MKNSDPKTPLLDIVRSNDQQDFNSYMDQMYRKNSFLGGMSLVFDEVYKTTKIHEQEIKDFKPQDHLEFVTLLGQWLLDQDPTIQQEVMTSNTKNFRETFFKRCPDVPQLLKMIDVSCFLTGRYDDVEFDCSILDDILQHTPQYFDNIVQHTSVQNILKEAPSGTQELFFNLLSNDNTHYAKQFFDVMHNHYAPQWIACFLDCITLNKNATVAQHMQQNASFQQWIDEGHFELFLTYSQPFRSYKPENLVPFEQYFGGFWNSVMNNVAGESILRGTNDDLWVEHIRQGHGRVLFVRQELEKEFIQREHYFHKSGQTTASENKLYVAHKLLDCLTQEDCMRWLSAPFAYNKYYKVMEHPMMVNALLTQEVDHLGSRTTSKKM